MRTKVLPSVVVLLVSAGCTTPDPDGLRRQATAISVGSSIADRIDAGDDPMDWRRLSAPGAGIATVDISVGKAERPPRVGAGWIAVFTAPGEIIAKLRFEPARRDYRLQWPVEGGQTYYLAVRAEGGGDDYRVSWTFLDPCEQCGPKERCVDGACEALPCQPPCDKGHRCDGGACVAILRNGCPIGQRRTTDGCLPCKEALGKARGLVRAALDAHQKCRRDSDCAAINAYTDCEGGCPSVVAKSGVGAVRSAVAEANANYCGKRGWCKYITPRCLRSEARCHKKRCQLVHTDTGGQPFSGCRVLALIPTASGVMLVLRGGSKHGVKKGMRGVVEGVGQFIVKQVYPTRSKAFIGRATAAQLKASTKCRFVF